MYTGNDFYLLKSATLYKNYTHTKPTHSKNTNKPKKTPNSPPKKKNNNNNPTYTQTHKTTQNTPNTHTQIK